MKDANACVLLTADQRLADAVGAAAAALGVTVVTVAAVEAALARWRTADAVLVGDDRAALLAVEAPPRRGRVHVVGYDHAELAAWSLPLGASVIGLPEGSSWLSSVLGGDGEATGAVLTVLGGSGGLGASTLAAGLAFAAHRQGGTAALVDLDPLGGGLDLVVGAERAAGWRWSQLGAARGEVGDVRRMLPSVDGVTLLSAGRGDQAGVPGSEAVQAVLGSLARHHDVVVVDAGRPGPHGRRTRLAGVTVLLCGAGVRQVAAAQSSARLIHPDQPLLVVRGGAGGVPAHLVADTLGAPLLGVVPEAAHLPADAEIGQAPGRRRSRWTRSVEAILAAALAEDDRGD